MPDRGHRMTFLEHAARPEERGDHRAEDQQDGLPRETFAGKEEGCQQCMERDYRAALGTPFLVVSLYGQYGVTGVLVSTDYIGLGPVGEIHPYLSASSAS